MSAGPVRLEAARVIEEPAEASSIPTFHSVPGAAARLGVSRAFVYREIRQGHLAAFRLRGKVVISDVDLRLWVSSNLRPWEREREWHPSTGRAK